MTDDEMITVDPAALANERFYTPPEPGAVSVDDALKPLQERRDFLAAEIATGLGLIKATYANLKEYRAELKRIDKVLRAARPAKAKPAK